MGSRVKRRTRVVGAFPRDQSFMGLGVSILIDIIEEWMTARKYLSNGRGLMCGITGPSIYRKFGTLPCQTFGTLQLTGFRDNNGQK
jgi:hypothetical protein